MESPHSSAAVERDLEHIRELSKAGHHGQALAAAEALTAVAPQDRGVLYLIATNKRCLNRIAEALDTLQHLERYHPHFSLLYQERGYCYTALRDSPRAIEAFTRGVQINPALTSSWSVLERLYRMSGDLRNAALASAQIAVLERLPPEIVLAGSRFSDGEVSAAESILRAFLHSGGNHVEALRLLARIAQKRDVLDEAELLLEAALRLAPSYRAARLDYIRVLVGRQKYQMAGDELRTLLIEEPENNEYSTLLATVYAGLAEHGDAIPLYRRLLVSAPESPELHVSLGHSLQAIGRQKEATASYRAAIALKPGFGDAWWSLANLKTYRFQQDEIERMRQQEAAPTTSLADRYHLCFALGKALEDRSEYEESWKFYERGNALKRSEIRYLPEITEINTRGQVEVCTAAFFAARTGSGIPDPDPIFIVGLPRSGSTLVEQILASHSQVEGTQELADIQRIALELQPPPRDPLHPRYPGVLTEISPEDFRRLGERYITGTRIYRKSSTRFFIDKMPNNFRHIGLIHLMMPNARIIDVRREPMACCFSNLKQLFARGQEFTYDIEYVARYYRTYLELMSHWDAVLPGRVLHVPYEDLVDDVDRGIRRILDFCGLRFEPACLQFYNTPRSVSTASSEQVRQPIFRDGLFQWRHYESSLAPLRDSLGDALTRYRQ